MLEAAMTTLHSLWVLRMASRPPETARRSNLKRRHKRAEDGPVSGAIHRRNRAQGGTGRWAREWARRRRRELTGHAVADELDGAGEILGQHDGDLNQ